MDSGVQSPDMMGYHQPPDPFYTGPGGMSLDKSMHAMVPHSYMPINPQPRNAEFNNRIVRLEQQQFQDGLNARYRSVQNSQSLQYLHQHLHRMQQILDLEVPSLRRRLEDLQAKLEVKENDECTRQIQLEPRTQEQKIQSAMKNPNLMRIYTNGVSRSDGKLQQALLYAAEWMETLAASLRGRVFRGGRAFLLEAEDAEAWAAKLREDAKNIGQPQIDNKLLVESKANGPPDADIANDNLEVEKDREEVKKGHEESDMERSGRVNDEWKRAAEEDQRLQMQMWFGQAKSAPSSCEEHTTSTALQDSDSTQDNVDIPKDATSSAQSVSANDSAHKSQHTSSSGVSIKIESSSESNVSSVQVEAVPELQTRRLAPHRKYASQQTQEPKEWTPEPEVTTDDKTRDDNVIKTQEVANVAQAQVPSKMLPPHRGFCRRATTLRTPKSDSVSSHRAAEVAEPQAVSNETKDETSPDQENTIAVKNAPATKTKKRRPNRRNKTAKSKALELQAVDSVNINQDKGSPLEAAKWDIPDIHHTATFETSQSSSKPQDKVSSEKQDNSVSTLDLNTSVWQPSYLKDLPLLSAEELEDIPSTQEMHTFDRNFITTHLGGSRWLPSFYSVPLSERSLLPGRGYYLLEDITEPLCPSSPGHHGSLVTPILRLPEHNNPSTPSPGTMHNAPLFLKRGERYIYHGMYTHIRSDRLDLERCDALIPAYLKQHWASQLTSPHRPKWATEALQQHLCPAPSYPRPSSSASEDAITNALSQHHQALESWHRDTLIKTSFLRPANILDAFAAPDTGAAIPGLRFWCLGLKCEGWDKGFYEMMCREEKVWEKEGRRDGEREREETKEMLRLLGKRPVKW